MHASILFLHQLSCSTTEVTITGTMLPASKSSQCTTTPLRKRYLKKNTKKLNEATYIEHSYPVYLLLSVKGWAEPSCIIHLHEGRDCEKSWRQTISSRYARFYLAKAADAWKLRCHIFRTKLDVNNASLCLNASDFQPESTVGPLESLAQWHKFANIVEPLSSNKHYLFLEFWE